MPSRILSHHVRLDEASVSPCSGSSVLVGVFHATRTGYNLDAAPRFAAPSDLMCINGQDPVLGYGEGHNLPLEPCRMARHALSPKQSTRRATAWPRLGMVILLGMVLLLFSAATTADVPSSTASGQVGIELHSNTHSNAERIYTEHPRPHCHHGHGTRHAGSALSRMEREDLEFEPLPLSMAIPVMAPRLVTACGTPSALPAPSPVAVYLLTRRFRV